MHAVAPRPAHLVGPLVTLVAHVDAESELSGGEVQMFLLMDGLRRRGIGNLLICPPGSDSEVEAERRGYPTVGVPMRNDLDLRSIHRLARRFRALRVDLIQLHTGRATWLGGIASALAGVPAITTRRMDRHVRRGWKTSLTYRWFVDHVVAVSPAVKECLVAPGIPAHRISVIWDGVDPAELAAGPAGRDLRAEAGLEPDEPLLLVLAALVHRKGIDVLIKALRLLAERGPCPRVWIAGRGPERASLVAATAAAGLAERVRFLGWRADKVDLLRAADCLVLPSRREGVGVAALEAMAAGVPVVASRVGGLGEAVVDGATGLLFEPGDPVALGNALERLLADPKLRARLGENGPRHVRAHYSADAMVELYVKLYARVLSKRSPARSEAVGRP